MAHLLHVDSSIRYEGSRSRALTAHFAQAWRRAHPDGTVTYRDLAADPAPHLTNDAFLANMVEAEQRTPPQQAARALAETLVGEIVAATELVVGVPLYNFGSPSSVKAWVDRIVAPNLSVDMTTGTGLLGGRRITIVAARGGSYAPGTPREGWDHAEPWLRHALSQVGLDDLHVIAAELTLAEENPKLAQFREIADASLAAAYEDIESLFAREPATA
jgi:FMN-dependent NADH-azoreductase